MKSNKKRSDKFELVAFLLIFGWEGPLTIYLGLTKEGYAAIIVGILVTLFFWGLFGIDILKRFIKGE